MSAAFDTLRFTQRLEQVGVTREQAIAHAELARDMIIADAATKADVVASEAALRSDLAKVETSLRTDIVAFKRAFEGSLRELELRMTIKIGAIVGAAVAIVAALQKFL